MPQFNTNCLCANCQRLNTYVENPRGASCKEPVAGAKLPLPWVGGAVVVAKGWLEVERVVEADELPANLFEVAAMGRTGEHAGAASRTRSRRGSLVRHGSRRSARRGRTPPRSRALRARRALPGPPPRSEGHTSELQ